MRGHSEADPSMSLLVPPKPELCAPKRGLCPKGSNRLGATRVQLEAWDPQNAGYHPRIPKQEQFFRRFRGEDFFLSLPRIRGISHMLLNKDLCFLVFTLEFEGAKFLCSRKIVYAPSPTSHAILAPRARGLSHSRLSTTKIIPRVNPTGKFTNRPSYKPFLEVL